MPTPIAYCHVNGEINMEIFSRIHDTIILDLWHWKYLDEEHNNEHDEIFSILFAFKLHYEVDEGGEQNTKERAREEAND